MKQNLLREIDKLSLELGRLNYLFEEAVKSDASVKSVKNLDRLCLEKEREIESLELRLKELHQDDDLIRSHAR
jgi:hypothetical protein